MLGVQRTTALYFSSKYEKMPHPGRNLVMKQEYIQASTFQGSGKRL
jgi:hypothetical protein